MAKSSGSVRVSFRWPGPVASAVGRLVERTGWSEAKAAAHLVMVGDTHLLSQCTDFGNLRAVVKAAEAVHDAEVKAEKIRKAGRAVARALLPKAVKQIYDEPA